MNDSGSSNWPIVLPVLTRTESTAAIFPGLYEVVFLVDSNNVSWCGNGDYDLLREFLLARKGTLSRLSIPPVSNVHILNSLRDHNPRLEVCFTRIVILFV